MESVDFLQCARLSILRAEKENGYLDVASILGPAFVWERSANVPAPSLTKAWHGCCESLSSMNVQHLRATARFSSHFTEVCKVDSHVSRRFPTIHLKNRRTFALFTSNEQLKLSAVDKIIFANYTLYLMSLN